jgi:hypothetical protein
VRVEVCGGALLRSAPLRPPSDSRRITHSLLKMEIHRMNVMKVTHTKLVTMRAYLCMNRNFLEIFFQ